MDEYMGAVKLFAGEFVPQRWLPCDGRLLTIDAAQQDANTALFSLLGTQFGGDGMKTFALPKMAPVATGDGTPPLQYCICVEGLYPQRP